MRKHFLHMALAAAVIFILSSCGDKGKVISRSDMSKIYADIIIADSWLNVASPENKAMADTTAFYEPIFRKYGYTTEDYLTSVEYYLNDPGRFSRILDKTHQMLQSEINSMEAEKTRQKEIEVRELELREFFSGVKVPFTDYSKLVREAFYTDRLDIRLDSNGVFLPAEIKEEVSYRGPRLVLASDDVEQEEDDDKAVSVSGTL